jgi:hypothetical protein
MRALRNTAIIYFVLSILIVLSGCIRFDSAWEYMLKKGSDKNPDTLLETAQEIEEHASSSQDVLTLIQAYKSVENADPENYDALWKIGNYHILMGAAFSDNKKDKKFHYKEAVKYCEKAMFTNTDFKNAVLNDSSITQACKELTIDEIDAMGYWYTARFYYFSECLRPLGRIMNTRIVIENNKIIELIDKLDPNWAGGGNYFSRALYFIAVPEKFGGSKERAEKEFNKAVEVGPDYIVNRWGRAKYLYSLTGNADGFESDLQWVIQQDPTQCGNPYAWNLYFQEDARKMLNQKK